MYYAPMYHTYAGGYSWLWGFGTSLFWFLFLILIIAISIRAMRRYQSPAATAEKTDPLDIVKSRYARGEINKDEFEQLKKDLK